MGRTRSFPTELKRLRILLLAMLVGSLLLGRASAQVPDVPGWQLAWHDEFDGPAVDTDHWELIDLEQSFNNEKQYYLPEQATIVDGKLRITATDETLASKEYRSARLESVETFGPGRFEARIDLPTSQGMWPAFWLNANAVPWPQGGEIDILENRGSQPNLVSSAYHWQVDPGPCCGQHQFAFEEHTATEGDQPVDFHDGFHVYAAEWEENQIRFYVDGELHWRLLEAGHRPIFETAKNIILNLAVGGDFGGDPDTSTIFPQTMEVDYVRYWQKADGLSGDYNGDGAIDAADYTVWRDSLGQTGIDLAADGSGNGAVDAADYALWKANFGTAAAAAAAAPVPEPAAFWMAIAGCLSQIVWRSARL